MFNKKQTKINDLERKVTFLIKELERQKERTKNAYKDVDRLEIQNKKLVESIIDYLKISGMSLESGQQIKIPYYHEITNDGYGGTTETFKVPELIINIYKNENC